MHIFQFHLQQWVVIFYLPPPCEFDWKSPSVISRHGVHIDCMREMPYDVKMSTRETPMEVLYKKLSLHFKESVLHIVTNSMVINNYIMHFFSISCHDWVQWFFIHAWGRKWWVTSNSRWSIKYMKGTMRMEKSQGIGLLI